MRLEAAQRAQGQVGQLQKSAGAIGGVLAKCSKHEQTVAAMREKVQAQITEQHDLCMQERQYTQQIAMANTRLQRHKKQKVGSGSEGSNLRWMNGEHGSRLNPSALPLLKFNNRK